MSVTGTGAGTSLATTGEATGVVSPAGIGDGFARTTGEASGFVAPAGTLVGISPHTAGTGSGWSAVSGTGDGESRRTTGAAFGGPVVVGVGDGESPRTIGAASDGPVAVGNGVSPSSQGAASGWAGTAAAGTWLYLHTTPPAQVYSAPELRGRLNPSLPMHACEFRLTDTRALIGPQNESFAVEIFGDANLRRRIIEHMPGLRIDVMDGGTLSRSGTGRNIDNAGIRSVTLDIEGEDWTRALPIRSSAELGTFELVEPLPWRFGRNVRGRCIAITPGRNVWLWADHASERIREVYIDGQRYDAFDWRSTVDGNGNPITIITTADAIELGAELVAVGDGALDSLSGDCIENPADVIAEVCRRAGRVVDRGALASFRASCAERGLVVSGSIDGGTLQAALVGLAESIGAVFSRSLPGLMRLIPATGTAVTIPTDRVSTGSQTGDVVTRIRARYAIVDGDATGSLEVAAPSVERRVGIRVASVDLPWIKDARVALEIATRMLQARVRTMLAVPIAETGRKLRPGDLTQIDLVASGVGGQALIVDATYNETRTRAIAHLPVGDLPAVELVAVSSAFSPEQYAGATIQTVNGERVITVTDEASRPIVGARCTLNGSITRSTDNGGRVRFPVAAMPAGQHSILIEHPDFEAFTLTVVI